MNIFLIYKQLLDSCGQVEKIDLVELDTDETRAISFSKLYNLQVPVDLRNKIQFVYVVTRAM
jgi:hypothetical protein